MTEQELDGYSRKEPRFFYGYIIVAVIFILQIAMVGPRMAFGIFFKPLINEFGWSRALLSGAFSLSSIAEGLIGRFMGSLNDKFGPRVVTTICGVLLGAGYLLMSLINATWQLYLFYVVIIGVAMGSCYVPQMSTVARWFVKRRGVMTGVVVAGGYVGGMIIPPITTWLISEYGWRNSYIIMGAVILVVIVLCAQFLRRDPYKMGLRPYGEDKKEVPKPDAIAEDLTFRETSRTRQLWMVISMAFCFGFCAFTIGVHIVPHATDIGISAITAANILSARAATGLIGGIVMGIMADRIGNRQGYTICFIMIAAGLIWLLMATEEWMLFLFAAVLGFGGGGAAALPSPLTAELFGTRSHGLVLGVMSFLFTLGTALGPYLAGYIFDVNGSYQIAFIICVGVAVAGLILGIILRPIKKLVVSP